MVEEIEHLKKDVEKAIGRVGAEYSYAKKLLDQLKEIENKEPDEALKEIRKAFHFLRWVGRAERRTDQSEKKIIAELKELGPLLPQKLKEHEEKLLKQLEVAEAKLVKAASIVSFTGELRDDLRKIQTDEQLLKKLEGKDGEKIKADLQKCFKDAEDGLKDLITWVSATETILENIEGFQSELEKLAGTA